MDTLRYWLAANYLPSFGPRTILKLSELLGGIHALFSLSKNDCEAIGLKPAQAQALLQPNWREVDQDLAWRDMAEWHHVISYDSLYYPRQLQSIASPPLVLYVKGDAVLLHAQQIAMVGSRQPSREGVTIATQFAHAFVNKGLVITSGLAQGIDTASHLGALSGKGKTIAVFGTGLATIYPKQNGQLADNIVAQGGALISEFPMLSSPRAEHFPRRNRIISGLSLGVVVVEAALKSGSLVTARHALSQGREVFAVPGSILATYAAGCHHLIQQGAMLVTKVDDVLKELNCANIRQNEDTCHEIKTTQHLDCKESQTTLDNNIFSLPLDLSAKEHHILSLITSSWIPFDQILLLSRLTISELSSMLLSLELRGLIQSVAGGYKRLAAVGEQGISP